MKYRVGYLGNVAKVAEYIQFNPNFELICVICERNRIDDDLVTYSLLRNIPLIPVNEKEEIYNVMHENMCDFYIMYSFGIILSAEITDGFEIYNIHAGYLPNYKGRHPTYWATVNNEQYIGATLHKVIKRIDAGEIVDRILIPYYFWMCEEELGNAMIDKIPNLLKSLFRYKQGDTISIENYGGEYYRAVNEDDKTIVRTDSYATIYNKIRAQSKYRGAKIALDEKVTVWIKNARFRFGKPGIVGQYYIEDSYLYVYLRENIWLKSNNFEIVGEKKT